MIKLIVFVVGSCFVMCAVAYRVWQGKKILRELNAGQRCLHCDSNTVQKRLDGGIDCLACGQTTSAALLSAPGPSAQELAELSKPSPDHRAF